MANLLTTFRFLLLFPFVHWMLDPSPRAAWLAGLVLAGAVLTDVLDGPVARLRGTATPAGRLADHSCDFLVVTGGMWAAAIRGSLSWALPALVTVAFIQYLADSYGRVSGPQGGLRMNRLGRINGVLYYVPPTVDILVRMGVAELRPWLPILAAALAGSTVLSMLARLRQARVQGRI